MNNSTKISIIAAVAILVVIALFGGRVIGNNDSTHYQIIQAWPSGDLSCRTTAGVYWQGFADVYDYEKTKSFYFNSSKEKVNGRGWEGEDDDEDDINVTLSRNANADISGFLKYQLPSNCEDLIKLHVEQRSDAKVKHDLVRNSVLAAVRKTAPLFTAEEAKVTKIAEFRRMAEDQLSDGEYLTKIETLEEKVGEDEVDKDGKIIKKAEVQKYTITKLKLDTTGNRIKIKESALNQYGIKVLQFEIQNVKLDPKAQQQLDIVKEREMQRITNATAAETAKQTAATAEAEGKARVAKEKADQEVAKIREVTRAEKERDVAVLNAQREKEVARLEAEQALEHAKKIKAEGEAEAYANRQKVAAGLTPQEKAEWEYKTKVGVAEALAKSTHPLVPEIMVSGEGKNGANPMDAVGLNMLMDITNKLSK